MRKRFEHNCEWCGELFQHGDARTRFCSRSCAGLGKKRLPYVYCERCKHEVGSSQRARLHQSKTGIIFCSKTCQVEYWKGHGTVNKSGYIEVYSPGHPCATQRNRVLQHRLVMEKIVGRYLHPDEIVHHKNGVKTDNKPENLELLVRRTHSTGYHLSCPECGHHFSIFPDGKKPEPQL